MKTWTRSRKNSKTLIFKYVSARRRNASSGENAIADQITVRKQYELSASVYAKRAEAIARITNFWPLVLEQAPLEIDQYIQPHDSRIFNESLINFEVRRPELDVKGSGDPRSLHFKFEFRPNDDFEDTVLEKTFWYRRAKDGWTGLVSEPVRVNWKTGKDITQGLTDMARALFEARTKAGDMTATNLPEYKALKEKVEHWNGMNTSFFTWFGSVSGRRWVSEEESIKANEEEDARKEKRKAGQKVEQPEEAESGDDELVEVHQAGDELAIALAEDLWPNATRFFTQAQEMEEMSDEDFEEDDEEMDGAEDDGEDEPVDIRALVGGGKGGRGRLRHGDEPPNKKVRFSG